MTVTVQVMPPHTLGKKQIGRIACAIAAGEEVDTDSLITRVRAAAWLAIVSVDGKPSGVGALKLPTLNHREQVTDRSGIDVSEYAVRYELGWVVVDSRMRGRKLSRQIVSALLAKAGTAGVFCTVRADNLAIQKACAGYGFIEQGRRWHGNRGLLALGIWVPT